MVKKLTFIKKMGQIESFNPVYLYITITYMTKLIMHNICIAEHFRMLDHSLLSNNVNFVEIGSE